MQLEFDFWNDERIIAYVERLAASYRLNRHRFYRFSLLKKLCAMDVYRSEACQDSCGFDWSAV